MSTTRVFDTPTKKRAIYYHTNWATYGRNYQVKDIPSDVMDIAYAFFNVDQNGKVFSGDSWADFDKRYTGIDSVQPPDTWNPSDSASFWGNLGQIKKLLDAGRKLNVQLSVGGWTWSKHFSDAVSTQANRDNFVKSVIDIFKKYPVFNGISIDWEYLSNDGINYGDSGNIVRREDSANFILLLKQLRSEFQKGGMGHYCISFCCVAAPEKAKFPVEDIHPLIDELHVMTYDFSDGNWGDKVSMHHTNPRKSSFGKWSCEGAADYYMSRGVPSTKIFIGAAYYSRGFANTDGIGKNASGGSPDQSWEKGVVDYKDLPKAGAVEMFDNEAKAAYSYDASKRVVNSYDNKESIIEKCKIVYEKNLGGIIVWENSGDKRDYTDPRNLTKVLRDFLTHGKPNSPSQQPPQPPKPQQPQPQQPQQPPRPQQPQQPPRPQQPQPTQPVEQPPRPQQPQQPQQSNSGQLFNVREWSPNTMYNIDNVVVYQKILYKCRIAHTSIVTWEPTNAIALWKTMGALPAQAQIERPNTNTSSNPPWKPNTAYSINSKVSYGGVNYQCRIAHTSIVSWEPPNTPALWVVTRSIELPLPQDQELESYQQVTNALKGLKIEFSVDLENGTIGDITTKR